MATIRQRFEGLESWPDADEFLSRTFDIIDKDVAKVLSKAREICASPEQANSIGASTILRENVISINVTPERELTVVAMAYQMVRGDLSKYTTGMLDKMFAVKVKNG